MDEYVDGQYTHDEHMDELSAQQQQQLLSATRSQHTVEPQKGPQEDGLRTCESQEWNGAG